MSSKFFLPPTAHESGDTETPTPETSFDFLQPEVDLDEKLYISHNYDDLFTMLHKKGGRFSYQISPLMKIPLEQVKNAQKNKNSRQKRTAHK